MLSVVPYRGLKWFFRYKQKTALHLNVFFFLVYPGRYTTSYLDFLKQTKNVSSFFSAFRIGRINDEPQDSIDADRLKRSFSREFAFVCLSLAIEDSSSRYLNQRVGH